MEFHLVKAGQRPLLAIPRGSRTVRNAAAACYPAHTWRKRVVRSAIRSVVGCGLGGALWARSAAPIDGVTAAEFDTWVVEVRQRLGDATLTPAIVWPADATRGRVYAYWLARDGRVAAFSKLALDRKNSDLIHNEQHALEALAAMHLQKSIVPRALAAGKLREQCYLVVETAPAGARITRWQEDAPIAENVAEYADAIRTMHFPEVERMAWWERFGNFCGPHPAMLRAVREAARDGVEVCRVHGDLNQTNILRTDGKVWLLDWERSSDAGPCMTDAVCMEVDRLWPATKHHPAEGLAAFEKAMWEGKDAAHRSRVLLGLAFLCAADFTPATAIACEWAPALQTSESNNP
jgi:hypothetical protein